MLVDTILLKMKLRLNKLDSQDYDNLEIWQLLELYNRAQLLFVRSNLHGNNIYREGDEGSKRRIDDFNRLLKRVSLSYVIKDRLITSDAPSDYMLYKSLSIVGNTDCCDYKDIKVYISKVVNDDIIKDNSLYNCSYEWGETYGISIGNHFEIDISCLKDIRDVVLTYYRYPVNIEKAGHYNVITKVVSTTDVGSEFTDDTTEVIIDYAVSLAGADILDGDIMNMRASISQSNN